MPKRLLREARFDFRGGLNTVQSPDLLNVSELRECINARISGEVGTLGAVLKRTGSRRMHESALGAPSAITGLTQWDGPNGRQVVAIANGDLYYRDEGADAFSGSFTQVAASPSFSTSQPQRFAIFRGTSAGAALRLYIADGGVVYEWNGTGTLTRLDGTNSVPNAELLASYHTRMFYNDPEQPKHLFWSHVGDPTDASVVANDVTSGGSAIVDLLTGQSITALGVAGSALLIATEDSLVRFLGYSNEDIRIEQDTEGLSNEIGVVGPNAMAPVERFQALVSEVGPYLATDSNLEAIGARIEDQFDALDRTRLDEISVAFHKGRREVWFGVPGSGDTDLQTVYVFSLRLQAWSGPFNYPFSFQSMVSFENPAGDEYIMAAGSDGFVRHMDTGAQDDVTSGGTGGSSYSMQVEFAPMFFETGPGRVKQLKTLQLQAAVASSATLHWDVGEDAEAFAARSITGLGESDILNYRRDLPDQGRRFRMRVRDDGDASIPSVHGFVLEAYDYQRY